MSLQRRTQMQIRIHSTDTATAKAGPVDGVDRDRVV